MDEKGIEQKIKSAVTSDFHINILVNFTWVPPGPSNLSKPQKPGNLLPYIFQIGPSINSTLSRAQPDRAYEFSDRTGPDTQICRTGPAGPDCIRAYIFKHFTYQERVGL